LEISALSADFPPPQYFSTTRVTVVVSGFSRTFEQPNRRVERCRAQVHVSLRRLEVLMSGELLDGPCGRSTHRQMRTERVPLMPRAA
jgi:hypothetical protein